MPSTMPRRRGRPSTVTKEKISEAVSSLGKTGVDVNMQNVASQLKVDVTTLYRHIGGQQELSRLLAEGGAPSCDSLPSHKGKTAREWLHELAWFYLRLMQANSDLMKFTQSVMDPKLELLNHVVGILSDYGFKPKVASYSYHFMLDVVVGFIYQQIRNEEEKARGEGRLINYQRNISERPKEEIEHVLACQLSSEDFEAEAAFDNFLTFALDGICAQLEK